MDRKAELKAQKLVNRELQTIGNYHDQLPISLIDSILVKHGLTATEWAIYCGRDGGSIQQVGPNSYISLTWHKMDESGRYEVVSYVN
jgi:hypothetical protein